jgi:hypothetical protein
MVEAFTIFSVEVYEVNKFLNDKRQKEQDKKLRKTIGGLAGGR